VSASGAAPPAAGVGPERPAGAAALASVVPQASAELPPLADLPCDAQGPVFEHPWQAQGFALALALHARGLFEWPEWAQYLSRAIRDAQARGDPDLGDTYYTHWVTALERLLLDKGVAAPLALAGLREAWRTAAEATPHGQPVRLNAASRRLRRVDPG
jgi:nitrile hydratase accessory protein